VAEKHNSLPATHHSKQEWLQNTTHKLTFNNHSLH
jgi:hypothetical protein